MMLVHRVWESRVNGSRGAVDVLKDLVLVQADAISLCVKHLHDLALDHGAEQHGQHLQTHPYQRQGRGGGESELGRERETERSKERERGREGDRERDREREGGREERRDREIDSEGRRGIEG